jgi:hypothetical protein
MDEKITPELLQQVLDSLSTDERNALLAHVAGKATEFRRTQMPGMIQGRQMNYTASPLDYLSATLRQIQGGQSENDLMQQMAQNLRQKSQGLGAFKQWGLQRPQQQVIPEDLTPPQMVGENWGMPGWKAGGGRGI